MHCRQRRLNTILMPGCIDGHNILQAEIPFKLWVPVSRETHQMADLEGRCSIQAITKRVFLAGDLSSTSKTAPPNLFGASCAIRNRSLPVQA